MKDDTLSIFRKQLDAIDNEILALLAKRIAIVKKVGEYKMKNNIPFFDPVRKMQIIENKLAQAEKLNLPKNLVQRIYELIHDFGLQTEEKLKK